MSLRLRSTSPDSGADGREFHPYQLASVDLHCQRPATKIRPGLATGRDHHNDAGLLGQKTHLEAQNESCQELDKERSQVTMT